jgi:DNA-binding MarR family transcriptional regulator
LAQVGAHATAQFALRMAELDLTPAQAGLMRLLAAKPGRSQKALAHDLGMPTNRFVPFIDELDERGLIVRRKNPADRRLHAVYLTDAGHTLLGEIAKAGMAHEQAITEALTTEERELFLKLLLRIAAQQGLTPGVHPGYRDADSKPRSGH